MMLRRLIGNMPHCRLLLEREDGSIEHVCYLNNANPDILTKPKSSCMFDDSTRNWFRNVEQALGFRLLYWQKYYILYGAQRLSGQTTAQILRDIYYGAKLSSESSWKAQAYYAMKFKEIQEKLRKNGIK